MCAEPFSAMRDRELAVERLRPEAGRQPAGPASTAGGAVPAPLDGRALVLAGIGRSGEEPKFCSPDAGDVRADPRGGEPAL
ncbi:MAG TPA: hypothetical protein VNT54_16760 [Solirubrobacteraceae bacterium]|nr:hypothetical protein [Solirubrobacteraceae bacterium]